ncbi:MAG: SH3 domain-containing protein [Candidatus Omnitrophica bacterium]|nr:SH3 domain-containing protein [Candidatus Omnitrophota bacterium]
MKITKIFSLIFLLALFLHNSFLAAQDAAATASVEEEFPKLGFVKNKGANIRAGDNINYESLCKLEKGDPIKIIGKRYSWYKIILPKKAHIYIKDDYVDLTEQKGIGIVNASRVNLRAGPDTKYSITGQVSKPQELNIVSETDGWYAIEPPKGTTGWINSSQIMYTLDSIGIGRDKEDK